MGRASVLLGALCAATALTAVRAEVPTPAPDPSGELVAYEGANEIRITDAACTNDAVLQRIDPSSRANFRGAIATLDGRAYQACWGALPQAIFLIYEDGDQGIVPMQRLKVPVHI